MSQAFDYNTLPRVVNHGDGTHTPQSVSSNASGVFRDSCEIYPNTDVWSVDALASGDFIVARGNTAGAGWIEISKSPFTADSQTLLSIIPRLSMPIKLTTMVSLTHRNAGESVFSQEFVSDDVSYDGEPVPDPIPARILQASQTTTTITIDLDPANPPAVPFRVGQVVSVYGFVDTRLNVNSATVASTPTPLQITLVGNDYAFTSTTIGTTLGTAGGGDAYIERVDMLGGARNGVSMVRSNGSATNARVYFRSQASLSRPSGTLAGSHNANVGTDAASALAGTAPYSESWGAPTETLWLINRDAALIVDRSPDAGAALSARFRNSQIVPNPERPYLIRFRVRSTPSLTRPMAKIVSVSKAGSTTATVTTDGPHGLTTGQYVGAYGVRDQTNFANLTTGAICTVTGANTFTVVWGASVTATSYGGFVMRVQGQQPLGGAISQVAQTVARAGNILTLVGNATWAAPTAIGNLVEVYGVRDATTGADLLVDGTYVVRNIATTTLTLEIARDSSGNALAPTGSDIVTTNCGGGVIQRFGARLHTIVWTDYEPMLTEPAMKGITDAGEGQLVAITGTVPVSMTSTGVAGSTAQDSGAPNPVGIGGRAANVNQAAMSAAGDLVHTMHTMIGAVVNQPFCIPEAKFDANLALTATSDVAIAVAAGAGLKRHLVSMHATNTGAASVDLIIKDGAAERKRYPLPVNVPVPIDYPSGGPVVTANTALNAALSAAGTVRLNAEGFTAP